MATINGSTNNSLWTFKLEATETGYSIANKTSTIRVQVYLGRASSQAPIGGNYKISVSCAGQMQEQNGNISWPTYINAGAWYLLKTFTFTVSNTGNPTTISISSSMSSGDFTPSSASASGSLTLTKLHDAPSITSLSLTETNTQMTSLGVANNTIVQYLSNKKANINVSTYDNATITNYSIYHNNVLIGSSTSNTITINFANVGELIDSGTGKVGLMVAVTDSLGGYNTKMFDFSVIKYTRPTIEKTSTTIKRKTGNGTVLTDNKVALNFVGTCYKGNDVIGNANKPTIQYKIWNTSEPSYSTLTTPNTANVTIKDYEISNILYTSVYNYKIKIYDVFTTTESTINLKSDKVPTGVSVWTEYKDRVDFNKITEKGKNVLLKPIILYEHETGSNGSITLNDNVSNYEYVEIYYRNNGKSYDSTKIYQANDKASKLTIEYIYTSANFVYTENLFKSIYIKNNSITVENYGYLQTIDKEINNVNTTDNYIYITRVVGYK